MVLLMEPLKKPLEETLEGNPVIEAHSTLKGSDGFYHRVFFEGSRVL